MSRLVSLGTVAGLATFALAGTALAGDSATIRIEPRPVYGATVTIEEGVRVIRPLPPEKYVIVNPGGATPLNLNLAEQTVTHHSVSASTNTHIYRDYGRRYHRSFIPAVGD